MKRRIVVGFFILFVFFVFNVHSLDVDNVHELIKTQFDIEHQYQVTRRMIRDLQTSKESFDGMRLAAEFVNASQVVGVGFTDDEVIKLKDMAKENFNEISLFEADLNLKSTILEKALTLLRLQLSIAGLSFSKINRFTSNQFGTVFIAGNGSLYYVGLVGNSAGAQGYHSLAYQSTSTVLRDPTLVNTTEIGDALITGVYSTLHTFVIKTSKNQLFTWGFNEYEKAGVGPDTNNLRVSMREINFGSPQAYTIKSVKCYTNYCLMLTEDGRLFFWGIFWRIYANPWSLPFRVAKVPVQIKVIIDNEEKTVHDFASSISISTSSDSWKNTYRLTVCVILDVSMQVYCAGENDFGQLGNPSITSVLTDPSFSDFERSWVKASTNERFSRLYGGGFGTFYALDMAGKLHSWGGLQSSSTTTTLPILGRGFSILKPVGEPHPMDLQDDFIVTDVCFGSSFSFSVIVNQLGEVHVLGSYGNEVFSRPYKLSIFKNRKLVDCSSSSDVVTLLFDDGSTYARGSNTNFRLLTSSVGLGSSIGTFIENDLPLFN